MLRILLICLLLLTTAITARTQAAALTANTDPAALLDRIKTVTEHLDVTADQKTQLQSIFTKAADDFQSAQQDLQNASSEEKETRFRNLLADLRQQIGQVLSDAQKIELRQKLQALRDPTTTPAESTTAQPTPASAAPPGNGPGNGQGSGQGNGQGLGQGPFGQNGGHPGPGGPNRAGQVLQRLKSSLNQVGLSADQQTRVDELFKDVHQQLQTLRASVQNGSLDRESARDQVRAIFTTSRAKLGNILTPDQLDQLRKSLAQNPGSPGNGHGGAGAKGGGVNSGRPAANAPAPPVIPPPASAAPPAMPIASAAPATPPAPTVGQQAPDFSLKSISGEPVELASYNHKLLVLVLGSYTNPSLRDRAPGLETLRNQFGTQGVSFLIVYTRETHPTGGWEIQRNKTDNIDITQPTTEAERNSVAEHAKEAMNLSIRMAPDTMDNKTAAAYAVGDGTPAYLIGRDGKILFHQSWLEPMALGQAIQDATKQ